MTGSSLQDWSLEKLGRILATATYNCQLHIGQDDDAGAVLCCCSAVEEISFQNLITSTA